MRIGRTTPAFEHVCTIIVTDSTQHPVRELKTDPKGRFRASLSPGKYFLTVKESFIPKAAGPVEVRKGRMTHADAHFDNGIR